MNPNQNKHAFYKTWKDKGDNIGVQCQDEKCTQPTFWTGNEPIGKIAIDPMDITKGLRECDNCRAIKELDSLKLENDRHKSETEECSHIPSQL